MTQFSIQGDQVWFGEQLLGEVFPLEFSSGSVLSLETAEGAGATISRGVGGFVMNVRSEEGEHVGRYFSPNASELLALASVEPVWARCLP